MMETPASPHRVVIVGGGFGGIQAGRHLKNEEVEVTLIDKRNFHLFQPLLYQVATGGLSPGDIASPIRAVFKGSANITVLKAEMVDLDPGNKRVILADGELGYDSLIVASGARHSYFGKDDWAKHASGLKTVEEALAIRRQILLAFEAAERERDAIRRQEMLTFVIVGGGPTGVELAGAIAELANLTLRGEFRRFNPAEARIFLIEAADRLLNTFPADLSIPATRSLQDKGVTVLLRQMVTEIEEGRVLLRDMLTETEREIRAESIFWAAGVQASTPGKILADRLGAKTDRTGRIYVGTDLRIPGQEDIYVIGDLAYFEEDNGQPLPGVAQVAMQQGAFAAEHILARQVGREPGPFHYRDKGSMAVIGRNSAVAHIGSFHFKGYLAWLIWIFIHIHFLIEYGNKLIVLLQWAWNYFTWKRGARLITHMQMLPHPEPAAIRNLESDTKP